MYDCHPIKLWCYWHVDKAWQEELSKKVSSKAIQKEVYEKLHFLRDITDKNALEDYLEDFSNSLRLSSMCKSFGDYFEKYWCPRKSSWAFCYRAGTGINTNMRIEAFHRVLKYNYLHGKYNRRVDVCLFTLLKFNRDKIFDRYIKQSKGKVSYKGDLVYQRHKASTLMDDHLVDNTEQENGKWRVKSEATGNWYIVLKNKDLCVLKCHFRCSECNVCSHDFSCSCMDFLTKNIPCKHIHFVKRISSTTCDKNETDGVNTNVEIHVDEREEDLEKTLSFIRGSEPLQIESLKRKVISKMMNLIDSVTTSTTTHEEALKTLDKQITAASNTFKALVGNKREVLCAPKQINPNTDVVRQKFYSTKKKRKNIKIRLAKPTLSIRQDLEAKSAWKNS